MKNSEVIDYWIASSNKDFRAMGSMFKSGHYVWALFLGHLVLEKVGARYPDYKGRFYKRATKKFAENYIKEIKDFRQWLVKKIKK